MKEILNRIKASFYFHVIRSLIAYHPKGEGIYLTFDDGPEPGITEFVLDELAKYNAKATFFCCGKNMVKKRLLLDRIAAEGHVIANHTFSHINGLNTPIDEYVADVKRVDTVQPTTLFRPPWGQMNFREYIKLRDKKIVLWDVESGDVINKYNKDSIIEKWKKTVKPGSIVLFHFSEEHAERTKDLLPTFLTMFDKMGYSFKSIENVWHENQ